MNTWKTDIEDYPVNIVSDMGALNEWIAHSKYTAVAVLCDTNTRRDCLPVIHSVENFHIVEVPAGEMHKNFQTISRIWSAWMQLHLDRKSLVLLLGGGVIGDMGGFAAATFKRGIDFVHIPTSLMAMTDSSIGGKLGINVDGVKNAAGLFKNPKAIFIYPPFIQTLSQIDLKSGWIEVIKHSLISEGAYFEKIKNHLLTGSIQIPEEILQASILIKKHFVERDPFEAGIRKALNFGHTIGHALEAIALTTGSPISHGEAVCQGMLYECNIARHEKYLDEESYQQVKGLLQMLFPHPPQTPPIDQIIELLMNDKKNENGRILFTLITGIGSFIINKEVSKDAIVRAFADI